MSAKKILLLLLIIITGLVSFYYSSIKTTLYTATGFSAKNVCSGYFISQFSEKNIFQEALIPISSLFSLVSSSINENTKSVRTNIFGFFERKAIYKNGLGCTLLAISQQNLDRSVFTLASIKEKKLIYFL